MIINSPLSNYGEVLPLIEAGASAFYCGIVPKHRLRKTADLELINRRPDYGANFTDINKLYKAKLIAEEHGAELTVAFNEFYPQSQLDWIKDLLHEISAAGIKKIIVADIGLLKYLADNLSEIEVTVSIMSEIFNSQAISLLNEINPRIKKVILPYHLSLPELKNIIAPFPEMQFETFVFNELCHYEVGLCNFTHNPYRKN